MSSSADSLSRSNSASILFERNLNTFNWGGVVRVDTLVSTTHIRLQEAYSSDIILIEKTPSSPERRLQSAQQQLNLLLQQPVLDNVSAKAQWSSLIYSDNKAVGLSTASMNEILGGVEYLPFEHLIISPMMGHRWDSQIGYRDRGLSLELSALTKDVDVDGYRIDAKAQFHQDRVKPRFLEQHLARVGTQKYFLGRTRDSMEIRFNKNRREFYGFASGALENRIENIFSFTNLLDYEFDRNFLTSVFVNVHSRGLEKGFRGIATPLNQDEFRNTGIDEFRLDAYVQGTFLNENNGVSFTTRLAHSERNERHYLTSTGIANQRELEQQEQSKDNLARQTSLLGRVSLPFTHSDRVEFSGTASILRYDTPSEFNNDDRDELLINVSLSTFHNVTRSLDVSFRLNGTLSHLVYLFSERSSNNNINRILSFSPRAVFHPFSFFSSMNAFEVLANYTVYDFEQTSAQVRSFSYRQFAWIDSTALEITDRFGIDFYVFLKLYDRGQLNWSAFTERRENSFVDKTYAAQARFSPDAGTTIAVGVQYFSQSRYSYNVLERRLDSFLRSFGPTCLIVWRLNRFGRIEMKGWYESRKLEGSRAKSLANMTMNINITL